MKKVTEKKELVKVIIEKREGVTRYVCSNSEVEIRIINRDNEHNVLAVEEISKDKMQVVPDRDMTLRFDIKEERKFEK